jgi:hypothetical protein
MKPSTNKFFSVFFSAPETGFLGCLAGLKAAIPQFYARKNYLFAEEAFIIV